MYKDPFTGRYHTHFRDYDPLTSRWNMEDPAGYADGLNRMVPIWGLMVGIRWGLGKEGERGQTHIGRLFGLAIGILCQQLFTEVIMI